MTAAALETIELLTAPNPTASIIWLHGLGADGNDFVPLVPELDLQGCGPIRFIFPSAPVMPVTINGGYAMRAWYDILGEDLEGREDAVSIRASAALIEALISHEISRGIAADRIVLAGFSQGCAMTLYVGLRQAQRLGGLVALSGYLPLAERLASDRHAANQDTPIFIAHGNSDPVVPLARGLAAMQQLSSLGYPVDWQTYPMQHSLCQAEISAIGAFLRRVLAQPK